MTVEEAYTNRILAATRAWLISNEGLAKTSGVIQENLANAR